MARQDPRRPGVARAFLRAVSPFLATSPRYSTLNAASQRREGRAARRAPRPSRGEKRGLDLAECFRVLVDLRDGGRDLPGIGGGTQQHGLAQPYSFIAKLVIARAGIALFPLLDFLLGVDGAERARSEGVS